LTFGNQTLTLTLTLPSITEWYAPFYRFNAPNYQRNYRKNCPNYLYLKLPRKMPQIPVWGRFSVMFRLQCKHVITGVVSIRSNIGMNHLWEQLKIVSCLFCFKGTSNHHTSVGANQWIGTRVIFAISLAGSKSVSSEWLIS
jgi:hypothetical protein